METFGLKDEQMNALAMPDPPNKGMETALNRIARALERLADAQQQIAEQGEPVDEDDLTGQIPFGHLGQRDG